MGARVGGVWELGSERKLARDGGDGNGGGGAGGGMDKEVGKL